MKHYESVDSYFRAQNTTARAYLKKLRDVIRQAAPAAEETISYGMPAFKLNGALVYFAAWQQHIGFYPGSKSSIVAHQDKLKAYETSAGTIKLPLVKPVPVTLIRSLVRLRVKENQERAALRLLRKKKG